jgi:hypothetical protein
MRWNRSRGRQCRRSGDERQRRRRRQWLGGRLPSASARVVHGLGQGLLMATLIMFRNHLGYECGDRGAENALEKLHRDNRGGGG